MKRRCQRAQTAALAPLPRDLEVLRSLAWARYLSTAQVATLHFPSRRVAQRRLRAILDHGFVRGTLQGAALHCDTVFVLTMAGAELVVDRGADETVARAVRIPRLRSLAHGLAIRDVFVAFRLADMRRLISIEDFLFEGDLARAPAFTAGGIVPDGLVTLRTARGERRLAVEVDLGTEPLGVLREKLSKYAPLVASGTVHDLVVVLAKGRRRLLPQIVSAAGLGGATRIVGTGELARLISERAGAEYVPPLRPANTSLVFRAR